MGRQVEGEVRITKLLEKNSIKILGTFDVLAWNASLRRVLLIECKNVQRCKTDGEIAEKLLDFRGE